MPIVLGQFSAITVVVRCGRAAGNEGVAEGVVRIVSVTGLGAWSIAQVAETVINVDSASQRYPGSQSRSPSQFHLAQSPLGKP